MIIEKMQQVRVLQKSYFETRSQITLAESRKAERELDALLATVDENRKAPITAEWLRRHGFTEFQIPNHSSRWTIAGNNVHIDVYLDGGFYVETRSPSGLDLMCKTRPKLSDLIEACELFNINLG